MSVLFAFVIATSLGVLSAFGVGGGTLLLVYLVHVVGLEQAQSAGVNLLFFLPSALLALPKHQKNGFLDKKVIPPAVVGGLLFALLGATLAHQLAPDVIRKLFGVFLIIIGGQTLFR